MAYIIRCSCALCCVPSVCEQEFVWKPTSKVVKTQATVRKVVRDGLICEKYHLLNASVLTGRMAQGMSLDAVIAEARKSPHESAHQYSGWAPTDGSSPRPGLSRPQRRPVRPDSCLEHIRCIG